MVKWEDLKSKIEQRSEKIINFILKPIVLLFFGDYNSDIEEKNLCKTKSKNGEPPY